ncbi:MAG: contact-dependent growth inhibition system immunity protein [Verrucomicrobiota bacterium]
MSKFDRNKSLQQLDGQEWGEPTYESGLVTECHRLRRVPLCEFTAEHLRMMIGQQIGLPYLVPIALEFLRTDPFTAGDFYEGDLLAGVLQAETAFWRDHPDLSREAAEIAERAFTLLPSLDDCDRPTAQEALTEAYHVFQRAQATAA